MMNISEFQKFTLSLNANLFDKLIDSTDFENISPGRLGNHLVKIGKKGVPIVRTTTLYSRPARVFSDLHNFIAGSIEIEIKKNRNNHLTGFDFNHALIEVYDRKYSKMSYHCDQSLDLEDKSYIGIFSCYENPDELSECNLRKLVIKEKGGSERFEILLTHNSVILFSVETNRQFLHKILLSSPPSLKPLPSDNKWLGITFRKSKTFLLFRNNSPYLANGKQLELANEEQKIEFLKLRGQENRISNFIYPDLAYTISVADRLVPSDGELKNVNT